MANIIDEVAYQNAIARKIKENASKTFFKSEQNREAYAFIQDNLNNSFLVNLNQSLHDYGKLTENQVNAVLKIKNTMVERKAAFVEKCKLENGQSNFIGNVKDKVTIQVTCTKVIEFRGQAFSYYDDGITLISIYKDQASNVYVYKGKLQPLQQGESGTLTGTVKEHKLYNETKQTILQRIKLIA